VGEGSGVRVKKRICDLLKLMKIAAGSKKGLRNHHILH
jgi:hypothetical protein